MEQKIIIIHAGSNHLQLLAERQLAILNALAEEKDGRRVVVLRSEDLAELPPVFNISAIPRLEPADYLIPVGELKNQVAQHWPSSKELRRPNLSKCSPAHTNKKGHFRP